MADLKKLHANLEKRGFAVARFATGAQAVAYLEQKLDGRTIGIGGSITVEELGLKPRLAVHNTVISHWDGAQLQDASNTQVYFSSVNAAAETGELVNIDGTCNRVASTLFGHEEVYFLVGVNKVTSDLESAVFRARNVAAPRNAVRLKKKTPCAVRGDKCYDCSSPERICRALNILWAPSKGIGRTEVILIEESLGY